MGWKRCPNLFRFQSSAAKGAVKWMVEPPTFVFKWAGWLSSYTRTVLEGGTYYSVCVWLVSMMKVARILRVGKLGVKVSLK